MEIIWCEYVNLNIYIHNGPYICLAYFQTEYLPIF